VITHRCKTCDTPVEVDLVDITTQADQANGRSAYLWGMHGQCQGCGSTDRPALVVDDTDLLTRPFDSETWVIPPDPADALLAGDRQTSPKETSQ
jgi:hypothetical protein